MAVERRVLLCAESSLLVDRQTEYALAMPNERRLEIENLLRSAPAIGQSSG